ncbi:MAG: NAD(P)-binding protein [Anaerolineae bacterium]|nr:NAD(P)-binding protein [Anaerolineae bacterium]
MDTRSTPQVIVVGAGVAGLSAALHLAERGVAPLILEADPAYCGGRLQGGPTTVVEHDGRTWRFREDHGVHGIWSQYRNLNAMLARHAIRPVFVPARREAWIFGGDGRVRRAETGSALRNSWVPAPFHYLALFARPRFLNILTLRDLAAMPRVLVSLLAAMSIDPLREAQPLEGMSLADFTSGWSPTLQALFAGLARNFSSAHPNEVPVAGFIAFLRFYTLLRRDEWAFSYFPADSGSAIVEPLVGRIEALGGRVLVGAVATRLEREEAGWRVCWQRPDGSGATGQGARHVVLAVDAPANRRILTSSLETTALAGGLRWPPGVPVAIVRLWFRRAPAPGPAGGMFSGDFVLDNFFWLHQLQDDFVRWHRETGGGAVEGHIYGPPSLLEEQDAVLMARAAHDVQRAYPELRGQLLTATLRRNQATHTLSRFGTAADHLGVETPWPGVMCCGDWVRHPTPALYLERACVTGIDAANAVLAAEGRPPWALVEHAPPERLAAAIERAMRRARERVRRIERARRRR